MNATYIFPGYFGDPLPTAAQEGQIVYMAPTVDGDEHGMQRRIVDIIGDETTALLARSVGLPPEFYVVFSGNVSPQGH